VRALAHKGVKRKPGEAEAMELGKTRASVDVGVFCELMAYESDLGPPAVERLGGCPAGLGLVPKSAWKV
jgi:hypothetical protein